MELIELSNGIIYLWYKMFLELVGKYLYLLRGIDFHTNKLVMHCLKLAHRYERLIGSDKLCFPYCLLGFYKIYLILETLAKLFYLSLLTLVTFNKLVYTTYLCFRGLF